MGSLGSGGIVGSPSVAIMRFEGVVVGEVKVGRLWDVVVDGSSVLLLERTQIVTSESFGRAAA